MEKKYYDLIISLIKTHRKYPGLEVLLEDIANDVYERSKIVFGTINNDSVISEYLQKVIAISIVTVPKKMNFNMNTKHRTISSTVAAIAEQKPIVQQPVLVKTDPAIIETNDLEPKIEESLAEENSFIGNELCIEDENLDLIITSEEDFSEELDSIVEQEFLENPEETILIEEPETEINNDSEETIENTIVTEDETITEIIEEEEEKEVEDPILQDKVNKELVDMMINGVPNSEQIIEPTSIEEDANEKENEELLIESDNLLDEDLSIELPEIENSEELIELEDDTLLEINHSDLLKNDDDINTQVNDSTITKTSFDCFNYKPSEIIIDEDEIKEILNALDKKYPQDNISLIADLKYNKKLSIDEIAENLKTTKESIINTLMLIIDSLGDYDINALSQM